MNRASGAACGPPGYGTLAVTCNTPSASRSSFGSYSIGLAVAYVRPLPEVSPGVGKVFWGKSGVRKVILGYSGVRRVFLGQSKVRKVFLG